MRRPCYKTSYLGACKPSTSSTSRHRRFSSDDGLGKSPKKDTQVSSKQSVSRQASKTTKNEPTKTSQSTKRASRVPAKEKRISKEIQKEVDEVKNEKEIVKKKPAQKRISRVKTITSSDESSTEAGSTTGRILGSARERRT